MTKAARYSLIAAICGAKLIYSAPTRADTREEIALNVSTDDRNSVKDNDLRDGDLPEVSGSSLKFDSPKVRGERETEALLTPRERAELRADLLAYRIRQDLSRSRNPYALAIV